MRRQSLIKDQLMAFLLAFIPEIVEGVVALAEVVGLAAAEAEGAAVVEAALEGTAEEAESLVGRFTATARQRAASRFRRGGTSEAPVTRFTPSGRVASTTIREGVGTGLAVGRAVTSHSRNVFEGSCRGVLGKLF